MKKRVLFLILLFLSLVFALKGAVSDVEPSPNWFRVDDPLTKFTTGHYVKWSSLEVPLILAEEQ